jgi:transposase-like protein
MQAIRGDSASFSRQALPSRRFRCRYAAGARSVAADALIASCYLAGTNTRRVRRALGALFRGAVGKDAVSRVWRKVKRRLGP